jgi:hypothetical protein
MPTAKLDEHPTVIRRWQSPARLPGNVLGASHLRRLCKDARADEVGFVAIGRPELEDQRVDMWRRFSWFLALTLAPMQRSAFGTRRSTPSAMDSGLARFAASCEACGRSDKLLANRVLDTNEQRAVVW